jgi:drug/metabolite transporter (DMT)-like permease
MLRIGLIGLVLVVVYKILDKYYTKKDKMHAEIDWWMAIGIVLASEVLALVFISGLESFDAPEELYIFGMAFYLLIPFLIIKFLLDYTFSKALIYSVFVPIFAIILPLTLSLFIVEA